jgi:hypothetical protein
MLDDGSNRINPGAQQRPPADPVRRVPIFMLIAWAEIIAASVALFLVKRHIAATTVQISQGEFLDRFASNQIVRATVAINQQTMPLAEIAGMSCGTDADGKVTREEISFTVHNFLLTDEVENELSHSPRISFRTPNTAVTNHLWGLAPFLILGVLVWVFFRQQIKKALNRDRCSAGQHWAAAPKTGFVHFIFPGHLHL